jgi:hypothetical protein
MRNARACVAAAALLAALQSAVGDEKSAVVSWEVLSKVSITRQKDRYVPEFSREIAALDKREVKLKGFMLPLEPGLTQKRFLLIAQPPDCGFCMPGGPEQIAEVLAKVPAKLPSDAIIVSGTFSLLRDDSGGLLYRLTEAVVVNK